MGPTVPGIRKQQQAVANQQARLGEVGPAKRKSAVPMGVGLDGASIYIRQEGWKELKASCVFDIELRRTFDPETREWLEQGHAVNNGYIAHLGGPEQFGQRLWAAVQQRGWEQRYDTQAIGDGAPWIWNLVNTHFYDSRQTVDYYHATEHLSTVANLLYPAKPEAAQRWLNRMEAHLFQGHAAHIAATLANAVGGTTQRHKDLRTQADYFYKHQRRMQYLEFREDGYPIGSGMVESEAEQFKARFCGPGMRWSRKGPNA